MTMRDNKRLGFYANVSVFMQIKFSLLDKNRTNYGKTPTLFSRQAFIG